MIETELTDDGEIKIHCPFCGIRTHNEVGDISECEHLYYVGISETNDPMFDRGDALSDLDPDDDWPFDHLKNKLSDQFLCFSLHTPAPGTMHFYLIYEIKP
tara:strand:+ start:286 stop:588 length:303 start_codon:yes stop_codon:yes gene_type:complete